MGLTITQVDAFTDTPFAGNPAAVCVLPSPQEAAWMQHVAQEMNLSETAFLSQQEDGFQLRWFTPAVEVDLCGHATLASAHVLWSEGYLPSHQEARFHTKSGILTAKQQGTWIEMNFPAKHCEEAIAPANLEKALAVSAKYVGKNQFDYLIEVESEEIVRQLKPDFTLLKTLPIRGIIVTSRATDKKYDFISRFFAPGAGVDEDPVTGSAHCCLGPYWRDRLGKTEFLAYQASPRGGVIKVRCEDKSVAEPHNERISLAGQAITVLRGELLVS